MEEIWKDIKGFEGLYQVSNLGRVRMLDVWVNRHYKKGCKLVCQLKGHIVKPRSKDGGTVRLRRGVEANFRIDKLVASHFMDDYKDGMIIAHIDGCTFNNAVTNLRLSLPDTYANEEWKDVKGFEGRYQVSNMGRVRSLDRLIIGKNGNSYIRKGQMMKPTPNNNKKGYLKVSLSDGNRNYTHIEMQRLVALHFCEGYKPGLVVNHKDECVTNNRADNLEWCTFQYNLNYIDVVAWKRKPVYQYDLDGNFIKKHKCCAEVEKEMGTYQGAMVHVMYESKTGMWKGYRWSYEHRTKEQWAEIIKNNKSSRKPIAQLDDDGFEIARFPTATAAAKFMGITVTSISKCCLGKSQKAAGYKWKYIY